MSQNKDIIEVLIIENPPVGTWAFGMKGRSFKVLDMGMYYLLHEDIDKTEKRRCIVKSSATPI